MACRAALRSLSSFRPPRTFSSFDVRAMSTGTFRALIVEKADKKAPAVATVKDFPRSALPIYEADGDDAVTVSVTHSSLNYKDGLVITGKPGVVKDLVIVPGIDFAGTVLESKNPKFKPGDQVVHTGWGVGERRWGGMSTLASSRGKWLPPLPHRGAPGGGPRGWK
mmetsp:Transcript_47639/g.113416  ORF Transcript_47639/g.113416 Transcript_47639/m.113416 type:complete len:166 (+) Transcript_47639:103-600(+)